MMGPLINLIREAEYLQIPKIIHQTWKDNNPPSELLEFGNAWRRLNPDWTYMFWTDSTARDFIRQHYPEFLEIYDNYGHSIMRVDAVRYFWMLHYGGLYVDLDIEPIKSVDALLNPFADHRIILPIEPKSHCEIHNKDTIISNAFIASTKQNSAWQYVIKALKARRMSQDPLVATGPFMLTDLYQHTENFRLAVHLSLIHI